MKQRFAARLPLICIVLGTVLAIAAIGMLLYNYISLSLAKNDAVEILAQAQVLMPPIENRAPEERGNNAMASIEIDGVNVIGVMELPQYGRTLPIASGWNTALLKSLPCRFTGSIYDKTLIIGATNGETQLDFVTKMDVGDQIILTDMEGGKYTYRVDMIQHSKHAALSKLQEGDYALTVFVKNSKNSEYLLIRCSYGK